MTPEETIELGRKAQSILVMPEFTAVLKAIKLELFDEFSRTPVENDKAREELHRRSSDLAWLLGKFTKYMEAAQYELDLAARAESEQTED